jgi:hypothetical protein
MVSNGSSSHSRALPRRRLPQDPLAAQQEIDALDRCRRLFPTGARGPTRIRVRRPGRHCPGVLRAGAFLAAGHQVEVADVHNGQVKLYLLGATGQLLDCGRGHPATDGRSDPNKPAGSARQAGRLPHVDPHFIGRRLGRRLRQGFTATDIDLTACGVNWLFAEGRDPIRTKSAWIPSETHPRLAVETVRHKPTPVTAVPLPRPELEAIA